MTTTTRVITIPFKRGTTAQNDAYTGTPGEITIDATLRTIRVHDGIKQGGEPLLRKQELQDVTAQVTQAQQSEANAATSAQQAAASATAASTSETNAAASAQAAANSQGSAAQSASDAATSAANLSTAESNAAASASAASTSANDAATSAAAAQAVARSYNKTWLGDQATDPTVDNNGDPLVAGAEYFNTTSKVIRVYDGAAWGDYDATAQTATQNAQLSASNAATSEANALSYRNTAQTAASNASTSETNALSYRDAAQTAASNAATSESNAATSASNAATSASNAATSEANAAASAQQASNTLASKADLASPVFQGDIAINSSSAALLSMDAPDTVGGGGSAILLKRAGASNFYIGDRANALGITTDSDPVLYSYGKPIWVYSNGSVLGNWDANGYNGTIGQTTPAAGKFNDFSVAGSMYRPARVSSSYTSGGLNYASIGIGNAADSPSSNAQFGYVYDATTPANSFAHITPYGQTEGLAFKFGANGNFSLSGALIIPSGTTAYGSAGTTFINGDNNNIYLGIGNSEKARMDASGNLGIGITPLAWVGASSANGKTLQGDSWGISSTTGVDATVFVTNAVQTAYGAATSTNWVYRFGATATSYSQSGGEHEWLSAATGTAGSAITWLSHMKLDASGNLLLGRTTSNGAAYRLELDTPTDTRIGFNVNGGLQGLIQATVGNITLASYGTSTLALATNGSTALLVQSTGEAVFNNSVGIGANPVAQSGYRVLHIDSADATGQGAYISLRNQGTEQGSVGSNSSEAWLSSGVGRLTLYVNGNTPLIMSSGMDLYQGTTTNYGAAVAPIFRQHGYSTADQGRILLNHAAGGFASIGTNGSGGLWLGLSGNADGTGVTKHLTFDTAGNIGVKGTPNAWSGVGGVLELSGTAVFAANGLYSNFSTNGYYNGTNWIYLSDGPMTNYAPGNGAHVWYSSVSGTAGAVATQNQIMTLDNSGDLLVGTSTVQGKLSVGGTIAALDSTAAYLIQMYAGAGESTVAAYSSSGQALGLYVTPTGGGAVRAMRLNQARDWVSFETNTTTGYIGKADALISGGSANRLGIRSDTDMEFIVAGGTFAAQFGSDGTFAIGTRTSSGRLTIANQGHANTAIDVQIDQPSGLSCSVVSRFLGGSGSAYHFLCYYGSTAVGSITSDASTTYFNTTSDYRLKEVQAQLTGSLDLMMQVPLYSYLWKNTGLPGEGALAHDIQALFPYAVTGDKDGINVDGSPLYQGVDWSKLVPRLIGALQELKKEFDSYVAAHP